jgi:acyl-CoA reductase-like NAD-dependent aldehyde dehydrogenase
MIADRTVGLASPFGGFESSGIGREYGRERLEEYFELQSLAP